MAAATLAANGQKLLSRYAPATAGVSLGQVSTPALAIDIDALRRNIHRATHIVDGESGVTIRPHVSDSQPLMKFPRIMGCCGCR